MKKKFSKILGVGLTLALLCSLLLTAAPVSALTTPSVTVSPTTISAVGADYNIRFRADQQLTGGSSVTAGAGAYNLAEIGDSFVITAAAATDVATITPANGTVTGTMSGTGTFAANVATFAAIGETCTITVLTVGAANGLCSGTWAQTTGLPTALVGVGAAADTITIVFQSDTAVVVGPTATITAAPGWINGIWLNPTTAAIAPVGTVLTRTVVVTLNAATTVGGTDGDRIGEGAEIRIAITAGITNPSAVDSYTLTVATSKETTAVTSAAYAVTIPVVATLPGVVKYYNPAGVLMGSFTGAAAIQNAITACPTLGRVDVGPGLYTETNITTAVASVVIKATGTAAETIVLGNFVVNNVSITIDGFTITPVGTNTTITAAGNLATIQNNIFTKRGTATTTAAETLLTYSNAVALGTGTVTANTFDTSLGVTTDNAIMVTAGGLGLTVSNNTFTVDGIVGAEDSAINTVAAAGTTTISGNTITGASGIGVTVNGTGTTAVTDNTLFSNLNSALNITGVTASTLTYTAGVGTVTVTAGASGATFGWTALAGVTDPNAVAGAAGTITLAANVVDTFTNAGAVTGTITVTLTSGSVTIVTTATAGTITSSQAALPAGTVTVTGNTIDVCGVVVSTTVATGQAAIVVNTTGSLAITNNTITNGANDIIQVTANADHVNVMFNNLTGNTLGVDNNDAVNTVNATHNWWGAATGAATGVNAGLVNATGYLGADATGTFSLATATVTAATTQKVDVSIATTAGAASVAGIIGVANYSANPGGATPLPAIANGFFDVYIGTPTNTTDVATIKLYGAVSANTVAYIYSALQGTWAQCDSQGVNTLSGYVWVNTGATITPSITDLVGTAFVLVEAPLGALTAPLIVSPEGGERDIPLTPAFSWTGVAAADGYYFELADNANFVVPLVKLDGDLGRLIVTAYAYVTELPYSSAYYWRVKAVTGTIAAGTLAQSAWVYGVFITMDEPEEPTPPIVIEEAPELPDITIEQPDITIQAPDIIVPLPDVVETPITPAWIYVIIGVGAVLVIALLVLIVRTRRVA